MAQTVYLETSIIIYLTARPSRDLVTAARQELTRDWWGRRRVSFDVYVSEAVIAEAQVGDSEAAARRPQSCRSYHFSTLHPMLRALPMTSRTRCSFRSARQLIRFMLRWLRATASDFS